VGVCDFDDYDYGIKQVAGNDDYDYGIKQAGNDDYSHCRALRNVSPEPNAPFLSVS